MFNVGDIVKYSPKWCTPGEEKYIHVIREIRLNPVTEGNRYLIETLNMTRLIFHPTETVDECMIELIEGGKAQ